MLKCLEHFLVNTTCCPVGAKCSGLKALPQFLNLQEQLKQDYSSFQRTKTLHLTFSHNNRCASCFPSTWVLHLQYSYNTSRGPQSHVIVCGADGHRVTSLAGNTIITSYIQEKQV